MTIPSTNQRNPAVTRLKSKHALLSSEISQLNKELLTLKEIIRHKQKMLRGVNIALIHKSMRGPFLYVLQKPDSVFTQQTQIHNSSKVVLTCLQGRK